MLLTPLFKYIAGGLSIALLLALAWGARVNDLRGRYAGQLSSITIPLSEITGKKVTAKDAPNAIKGLANDRDRYRNERDTARNVIETQSNAIRAYEAETHRLKSISAENEALAAKAIADRNTWIAKAKAATNRKERLACEAELKETEAVLDALYDADF